MAVTKIFARKGRLDIGINYILNGDKTEERVLAAHLNCDPDRKYRQMMDTRRAVGKEDGVQYYHIIQSFKPGEVTPEQALIMELPPVNFYTISEMEKGSAIADLAAYLKIVPSNLQINVLTQEFTLNSYMKMLHAALEREENQRCREMIKESMSYVPQLVEREAITHRSFLFFASDPSMKAADSKLGAITALLNEKAEVVRRYPDRGGQAEKKAV